MLPKIASRKIVKLSLSPLPTLPFPRKIGNEIYSPLKQNNQESANSFNVQGMIKHMNVSPISSSLTRIVRKDSFSANQGMKTIQYQNISRITPSEKTLAILQMHQRKKLFIHPINHVETSVINKEQSSLEIIKQTVDNTTPLASFQEKLFIRRKKKVEVKEYMLARGLQPTPLEFFKLVSNQQDLSQFFCYCNRNEEFYDFDIVPFTQRNENEYLTVSQRGLVHFLKGEPNFVAVSEWELEANVYRQVRKIPFFRYFKNWKTFSNWKTLMRRTMYTKTRQFLKRELFILDAELSKPMFDIRMKAYQLQRLPMINMCCDTPNSTSEFSAIQNTNRTSLAENLAKIDLEIGVLLTESCNASMRTFKEENRISLNDDPTNYDQQQFLVGDETHKQMPFTQEATKRIHYKKLSKYIQLTDFMIVDARLKLIKTSLATVLSILQLDFSQGRKYYLSEGVQGCALFEIHVNFNEEGITFSPQCFDIKNAVIQAIEHGIETVKHYAPYLEQTAFVKYSQNLETDEIFNEDNDNLALAIGSNRINLALISQQIQHSYNELRTYSLGFDPFIRAYEINLSFNVLEAKSLDQEEISTLLYRLDTQYEEIVKMDVNQTVMIFKINGEAMKLRIMNCQKECQRLLRNYVPKLQFDIFQEIYVNLSKDYNKISSRPRKIDDYVALMNYIRDLTERMDVYNTNFYETERMGLLMEEHRIKFPERNRNRLKETQSLLIDTKRAMVEAFEGSQQYKLQFKKELIDLEIPKVKIKIQMLKQQLIQDGVFESENTKVEEAVKRLDTIGEQVKHVKERGLQLNQYQKFLDLDETGFENTNEVYEDWQMKHKLWFGLKVWTELSQNWLTTKFTDVNVEDLSTKVEKFATMANVCSINMRGNQMAFVFKHKVDALRAAIPVVTYLRDDALQERHWNEIFKILGMRLNLNGSLFTLNSLIELKVQDHKDKLEEISLKAKSEQDLERQLDKLTLEWKKAVFEIKQHRDSYYIIVPSDLLNSNLEDSLSQLSKMLGARFIQRVKVETEILYKKLQFLENLLSEWVQFQISWMYLENIFNSADITSKMGQDAKRFQSIDHLWKDIMKQTHQNPLISRVIAGYNHQQAPGTNNLGHIQANQVNYLQIFKENNSILDEIQKSLEVLLEKKRSEFPRFYFLSNEELLQILSKASKEPYCVQLHLRKLFENIATIELEMDDVIHVYSSEQEKLKIKRVRAIGIPVERWLHHMQESVNHAVKKSIKEAYSTFREDNEEFRRHQWVLNDYPAQSICLVASIMWCTSTETLLKLSDSEEDMIEGLDWWLTENIRQLKELTKITLYNDLDGNKRKAIVSLITQDVHYRDIIDLLLKEAIQSSVSIDDFKWQQQLRYYLAKDDIQVRQVNAHFTYGYEYLGPTSRIVITPLTDKCWLTITGALHLKLGAAPSGPAGTGKTESTKDLAKALGKYCVVFNCSDQINFKIMEQLFLGLSMTGSWACLDEFNRIDIEVLSVIAQQLQTIRQILLSGSTSNVILGDKRIERFVPSMGVFITMNPGYKGRTELPDNLKVLFRPVSMMIPDYSLIAEIMLFSEGFQNGKQLSRKMTRLYKLASEQLSYQIHYDFGMRAVKAVLVMAGQIKRMNPLIAEELALIKAMRDSNVPKFLKDDLPLFNAIVQDLFPGTTTQLGTNHHINNAIDKSQLELGLITSPNQSEKIVQLYNTINVRFGVMMIGATLTGKSTILKTLQASLNLLSKLEDNKTYNYNVESEILNPKSITLQQLYGNFSHTTQEWTDGLGSSIIRRFAQQSTTINTMKWVIFDGPVDAIWIENLNTVLDDNMTLCLSNGERIKLRPEMRMLFEIDDLAQASPATVSRCGMVYTSSQSLSWRSIVQGWLMKLTKFNSKNKEHIWNHFDQHIDNTIDLFNSKQYKQIIPMQENNLVLSLCRLMQAIFEVDIDLSKFIEGDSRQKKVISKVFIISLVWTFGGCIDSQHHSSFENYLGNVFTDLPRTSIFDNCLYQVGKAPAVNRIDYQLWSKSINTSSQMNSFFEIVVPTKDIVCFSWLLRIQLLQNNPVFLTGVSGVGKTIISNQTLNNMKQDYNYQVVSLAFSSQTSAADLQNTLEDKLEKKRRNVLGGKNEKKVIIFVDDINMPSYDQFGTQSSIELLRQIVDYEGIYDREGLFWKYIANATIMCAAAPPGGGRKILSERFTNQFHMLSMPPTQEESLISIFNTILGSHFKSENGFRKDMIQSVGRVVESTIILYFKIIQGMRPTPNKQHYIFNMRDIARVIQGIVSVKSAAVNSLEKLSKLWVHETSRVFHDRLVTIEDRLWLQKEILNVLKIGMRYETTFDDMFLNNPIYFCDFLQRSLPFEERSYQQIPDRQKLTQCIKDYIEEYNFRYPNKSMNLVLFHQYIDHLIRICRILRQKRSNGLIVGVSGSGKQTITRLAAFVSQCKLLTLGVKVKISQNDFRDTLRSTMMTSGINNERTALMISENHLTDVFLEDINNFMNTGDIPNLWSHDDKESINKAFTDEALLLGIYENVLELLFLKKIRDNMHLILCMSPIGDQFRKRIRMFPSLINCCQIDWLDSWPQEAMLLVSLTYFDKISIIKDSNIKTKLSLIAVKLHQSIESEADLFYQAHKRKVYTSPSMFLDFHRVYTQLMEKKVTRMNNRRYTLTTGSEKLNNSNDLVIKLSQNMITMQPQLAQSVIDTESLSLRLEKDRVEANRGKKVVEDEKKIVDYQTADVQYQYNQALSELTQVLPALQEAEDALNTLNHSDITELRATKSPSKGILNTIIVTVMLLEKKADYRKIDWKSCQQIMSIVFFEKLKNFDKDELVRNEKLSKSIDSFIQENPDFTPENVRNSSKACFSLCKWCYALINYSRIAKQVLPKQQHVSIMEQHLKQAQSKLFEKQNNLDQEMKKVQLLEHQYSQVKLRKKTLEDELQLCKLRLERSARLTEGLADESVRWKECIAKLDDEMQYIIAEVFLASSFINYMGPFTGPYRRNVIDSLKKDLIEQAINLQYQSKGIEDIICEPIQVQNWRLCGLPSDSVSIQNAVIVTNSLKKPLMIDPQQQATKWIKQTYLASNLTLDLKVTRVGDSNYQELLEQCIKIGSSVLIEDISVDLDPILEPIFQNQVFRSQHGRVQISFGDTLIDYHSDFKLYLSMRDSNPHLTPETFMKLSIVNFTVTPDGLSEQLLSEIVRFENVQIEEQRNMLAHAIVNDQIRIIRIQEGILSQLANSIETIILDDIDLIEYLQISKETSLELVTSIQSNSIAQEEIMKQRSLYETLAKRGSIIYFTITDLSRLDSMYQNSLDHFKKLFLNKIKHSTQVDNQRISTLIQEVTEASYLNICRGLFSDDRLIYAFTLAVRIQINQGGISQDEWSQFLKGASQMTIKNIKINNPDSILFSNSQWRTLCSYELCGISEITKSIETEISQWRLWMCNKNDITPFPGEWEVKLSPFQKLMIIKCLREQDLIQSIRNYVQQTLGNELFAKIHIVNLEDVYADSTNVTPTIYILKQGAEPTHNLQMLNHKITGNKQFIMISLGQGQDKYALACIEKAFLVGQWVLLQNCHLYESFMPTLEKVILTLGERKAIHPDFRLLLTSMPCQFFSPTVLQESIKITYEPSKGIKANIKTSLQLLLSSNITSPKTMILTYSLCFFHAVIQERRKFGPRGFNIKYEFNESDLSTAHSVLLEMTNNKEYKNILWESIQEVIGEVIYGGRITDDADRRIIKIILQTFICEDVFSTQYKYSQSAYYRPPQLNDIISHDNLMSHADKLPEIDLPEIFGMNESALIASHLQESQQLIKSLLLIQHNNQSSNNTTQKSFHDREVESIANKILLELPDELSFCIGASKEFLYVGKDGLIPSMTVFLRHEVERFNLLIRTIKQTLAMLLNAVKGIAIMSDDLEQLFNSVLSNKLPEIWAKISYPSLKPLGSYLADLKLRIEFMRLWLQKGKLLSAYWLSAFFFQQGFLTSVLQNYSRQNRLSIENLRFIFQIQRQDIIIPVEGGVLIYGLFMESGCINSETLLLEEETIDIQKYHSMPMILFKLVSEEEQKLEQSICEYMCPLYKTSERAGTLSTTGHSTNFIINVILPTKIPPRFWILRGTALLCQLDD